MVSPISPVTPVAPSRLAPSRASFALVPSDGATLPTVPEAIYVGIGATVTLRGIDAVADVTYRNFASSSYLLIRAQFVRAIGTTAIDLIGEA